MGMDTGGSGGGPSSDINVTPLVDVCLVLLIIFMVMIPKNVPEISVQMPPEKTKKRPPPKDSDTLIIKLSKEGAIQLNETDIPTRSELAELISSRLQGREKKVVFIDFDDDANYGTAVEILDLAKRSGATVLGIIKKKNEVVPGDLTKI